MRYTIFVCFLLFAATTNAQEKCTVDRLSEERDRLAIQLKRASCFGSLDPNSCKELQNSAAGSVVTGVGVMAYHQSLELKKVELKRIARELRTSKHLKADLAYYRKVIKTVDAQIVDLAETLYPEWRGKVQTLDPKRAYRANDLEDATGVKREVIERYKDKIAATSEKFETLKKLKIGNLPQQIYWLRVLGIAGNLAGASTLVSSDSPRCSSIDFIDLFSEFEGCEPLPIIGEKELGIFTLSDQELQKKIEAYPKVCDRFSDLEKIYSGKIDALIESNIENTNFTSVKCNGNSVEYVVKGNIGFGTATFTARLNEKKISSLDVFNSAPTPQNFKLKVDYADNGKEEELRSVSWDPKPHAKKFNGGYQILGTDWEQASDHPMASITSISQHIHKKHWPKIQSCCSGNAKDCPQEKKGRKQEAPAGEKTK